MEMLAVGIVVNDAGNEVNRQEYLTDLIRSARDMGSLRFVCRASGLDLCGAVSRELRAADVVFHHCGDSNTKYADFVHAFAKLRPRSPIVLFSFGSVPETGMAFPGIASVDAILQPEMEANLVEFLRYLREAGAEADLKEAFGILHGAPGSFESVLQLLNAGVRVDLALTNGGYGRTVADTAALEAAGCFEDAVVRAAARVEEGGALAVAEELVRVERQHALIDGLLAGARWEGWKADPPFTGAAPPRTLVELVKGFLQAPSSRARSEVLVRVRDELLEAVERRPVNRSARPGKESARRDNEAS
jgi:hypothetical protein